MFSPPMINLDEEKDEPRRPRQPQRKRVRISGQIPISVLSDGEEEESNIESEIKTLLDEVDQLDQRKRRLKYRLRRCYQKREEIRIRKAIKEREREIRNNLDNQWLPSLRRVQQQAEEVRRDILDFVAVPSTDDFLETVD